MNQFLTDADTRVLGALIEKQMTTPDNYPLSMNALVAACNQSSNRNPVVSYDDEIVLAAIARLRRAALVRGIQRIDSRVTKYEHTAPDTLELSEQESALLCVLMLRGPNTIGELRTRTERLAPFENLAEIEATLTALMERETQPLVVRLPRKPGQKEVRYAHLLSGAVAAESSEQLHAVELLAIAPGDERVAGLEQTVAELQRELAEIRRQLEAFRKQFE